MIPINLVKLSSLIFFSLDTFGELNWTRRLPTLLFLHLLDAFFSLVSQLSLLPALPSYLTVELCLWYSVVAPHGTNHIFTGCRIDGPEVVILSEFHSDNCVQPRPRPAITRWDIDQAGAEVRPGAPSHWAQSLPLPGLVWPVGLAGCVDCDEILRLAARHTLSLPASRTTNDNINKICQDGSPRSPRLTIRHQTLSEILPPRFRFLILKLTLSTGTLARNIFDIFSRLNCTFVTVKVYLAIKIHWTAEVSGLSCLV